jgi:DNA-binding LacI/PurR family transcriptional regulator
MVGAYHEDFVLKLRDLDVPMVLVDEYIPSEDILSVMIDNTDGIIKACKYLHELNHVRIAYISERRNETTAFERFYGFKQAQEMFGFIKDDSLIAECDGKVSDGYRAMEEILEKNTVRPTAVLAYNDIIAFGAMDAIKHHGLSIPEDISVVGFDDINMAKEVNPPLTTVHVPRHLMGVISVQRLIDVIQGKKDLINKVLVPTKLQIRKSTSTVKT